MRHAENDVGQNDRALSRRSSSESRGLYEKCRINFRGVSSARQFNHRATETCGSCENKQRRAGAGEFCPPRPRQHAESIVIEQLRTSFESGRGRVRTLAEAHAGARRQEEHVGMMCRLRARDARTSSSVRRFYQRGLEHDDGARAPPVQALTWRLLEEESGCQRESCRRLQIGGRLDMLRVTLTAAGR